ncbi:DUF1217 domain-containing protein [Rhizobium sp. ARZ01]|uniref:DUF1217 domain-containing protein n=1 Tax=Rhizobium sp. ARZ01 TaxID=2769313 RepID=UPI0017868E41|nr:DUF1217 domain-containing protein [Rhizobium sp. ARZ01]MBD9371265.1 DUF1217 domain-containing protein [Rhizobium sp. ARZ01]
MLSTYTSYSLLAKDMLTSLSRVSQQTINAREAEYYKANIGKVGSVDEFLDDYRLYNYAVKAYGLEDMAYAKAFMRKVLESDLTDPNSFVNLLTDTRYRSFANAFSFEASSVSAQTEAQLDEIIGLYSATVANAGSAIKEETRYYNIVIDTLTDVDQLLNNDRLRNYMFTAFGVDPKTYSRDTIRQLLTSDLNDPASYFNTEFAAKIPVAEAARQAAADELAPLEQREAHLRSIAKLEADIPKLQESIASLQAEIAALSGNPDGLGDEELQAIIAAKQEQLTALESTLTEYQDDLATKQTAVADLDALLIPRSEAAARIAFLKAESARQTAVITTVEKYHVLAAAYNFNTDGTATAGTVQDADQKKSTNELYTLSNPRVTTAAALLNKEYFESRIGSITTVEELVSDPRLLAYVKVAFDLDKSSVVAATIRNVLTSDPDPDNASSYINQFGGANKEKYFALRAAFNFQEDGTLAASDAAQTAEQTAKTGEGYLVHYNDKDDAADELAVKRFKSQIGAVKTVQDFVGEATIYNFALKAFDIDPSKVSALTIKNVLKSDLNDPRSYVYQLKDERFVELAKAFNFGPDGNITQPKLAQAESETRVMSRAYVVEKSRFGTEDDRKLAEEEAKYFSVQMQKVESVKEFLSDARLVAFVLEANGIDLEGVDAEFMAKIFTSDLNDPDSFVNQQANRSFRKIVASFNFNSEGKVVRPDDAQIQSRRGVFETIDSYIRQMMEEEAGNDNAGVRLALYFERKAPSVSSAYDILADDALYEVFKTLHSLPDDIGSADIDAQAELIKKYMNLEDLQDPEKVSKMIAKFAVLYDVENFSETSGAVSILSGGGNISADTLLTMAQLRTGGM